MEIHQHLVVEISLSVYGKSKQEKNLILGSSIQQHFEKCKISLFENNHFAVTINFTFLCISQTPIFQAQGALVLMESLLIIKASIQDKYQNQKEFAFWKAQCKNNR